MAIDDDLVNVLRELVEFLETLCDAKLPDSLENIRSDLLRRSRTSLGVHIPKSTSPEPYLEMKPGKGKGKGLILPKLKNLDENNLTEYIDADHQPPLVEKPSECQNEYESFASPSPPVAIERKDQDEPDEQLKTIYSAFSAEQTKSKCYKWGPLQQLRDERNIFMKVVLRERPCWVGLVGTYLLIYDNKDSKKPREISSIRGFSARPAPSLLIGDSDRSKSAFEIFCPGSKTLQYIGRAPKDMEQWVAAINRIGTGVQTDKSNTEMQKTLLEQLVPSFDSNSTISEEQYQDIGQLGETSKGGKFVEKPKEQKGVDKDEKPQEKIAKTVSSPPPLPARIPRRLPSLPQTPVSPVLAPEDIAEGKDDIYYTIEDMQDGMTYINLKPAHPHNKIPPPVEKTDLEVYDDIQANSTSEANLNSNKNLKSSDEQLETYDEVGSAESKKENSRESPKKKSFFDRFKRQRESPKKEDHKKKEELSVIESPRIVDLELPTYDDVRGISPGLDTNEEQENYTCPPAPRPVFSSPIEEEIYDDIGHMRENERVESSSNNDNCELEHYQVPKAQDPIDPRQLNVTCEEDIYDDVAIRDQFRARQRDSACSSSSSERAVNTVTKAWSKFSSGKRNNEKNGLRKNESEEKLEGGESGEDGNDPKVNKFHKLKSKMEHALNITGKPPIPHINRDDGH
ncbi:uncharacterized protein [Fopius arisanus]|uniref:Skap2-b protein n=1 Tax=Fopius arisanus TaxID=64838 RepID=A0A0C9R3I2_9HYME|nr:PREDICTED: uncharacterized protein LOC105264326 [Fopius arisanus]